MHATEADTPKRSGRELPRPTAGKDRFDAESARRILERAAAEQQRLDNAFGDSWSFEELQEMAVEAGISPEVLRAAVEAHRSKAGTAAGGIPAGPDDRPRSRLWAARAWLPGNRSGAVKAVVLATAAVVVFAGLLLAFPAVAEATLWALLLFLVLLSVLILLGAAPF